MDSATLALIFFCFSFGRTLTSTANFYNIVGNLQNGDALISNQCIYKNKNLLKSRNERNIVDLPAIVSLLNYLADEYNSYCTTVVLYDEFYGEQTEFLKILFATYPMTLMQGKTNNYDNLTSNSDKMCKQFLLILSDPTQANSVVGDQNLNRVIVVTQVSRWKVEEFLRAPVSQRLVNLLVIRTHAIMDKDEDIVLYTHDLFVDGLGSSSLRVLTTWRCGVLTRPSFNLFPEKMTSGFRGHKFSVGVGDQPPFIVKRGHYYDGKKRIFMWDGLELRLLWLLGETLDFSINIQAPEEALFLPEAPNVIAKQVKESLYDIAVSGIYITPERHNVLTLSSPHTQDCAAFLTITSTALPRYRAIMGPFHWTVWLALTLTYLLAIFPISFSDSHSLMHLLKNPWQMENMFWYVFGTFTNCFTFKGEKSWSSSHKAATRMLIGWYWVFSIIISACYTGSIIAFVTLPVYPPHYDNCYEVVQQRLQVGTLSSGGWQYWFNDSVDPVATQMFEKMEYLPDLESALHNVTTSYYRNYAFLGSSSLLEYLMKINYTKRSEGKSYLYLGKDCFVSFSVAMAFPPQAPHSRVMSKKILQAIQSGLVIKLKRDLDWDLQRSSSGKLLAAVSGSFYKSTKTMERKLTLEDVQGMFLLLGAGFGIASLALLVEILAWLFKYIRAKFCSNKANEKERNGKPLEDQDSCNSQQEIFLSKITFKRRVVSGSVFRNPRNRLYPSSLNDLPAVSGPDELLGEAVHHQPTEDDCDVKSTRENLNTARAFTF